MSLLNETRTDRTPAVSVVIPAYRAEGTLTEAVSSCLEQSASSLEVLIVEDGSDDGTLEVAYECQRSDPGRVRVLQHARGRNAGVAASRNLGLVHARGAHVAFLDADDAWLPEKLRIQLDVTRRCPHVGFVFGDVLYCVDPDPSVPMSSQALSSDPVRSGMEQAFSVNERAGLRILNLHRQAHRIVPSPTPLVRRELFSTGLRFAGREKLRLQYEDFLMWKVLSVRTSVYCVEAPLGIYRVHASSFTGRFQRSGSTLRHLQAMDDVHREFVAWTRGELDDAFLRELTGRQTAALLSRAHKITLLESPGYIKLAAGYGVATLALTRLMRTRLRRVAGVSTVRRLLGR